MAVLLPLPSLLGYLEHRSEEFSVVPLLQAANHSAAALGSTRLQIKTRKRPYEGTDQITK